MRSGPLAVCAVVSAALTGGAAAGASAKCGDYPEGFDCVGMFGWVYFVGFYVFFALTLVLVVAAGWLWFRRRRLE